MAQEHNRFTVTWVGHFPIDMLRYDSCWPFSSNDSAEIERSFKGGHETHTCQIEAKTVLTVGRWESFGAKVGQMEWH